MPEASPDFAGLRVAAFESRRTDDMSRMIEKFGGVARVSPSMREVSLDDHREVVDFAMRLITGHIDAVVLLTGVGIRHLIAVVERHVGRERFLDALRDVVTISRGPKSVTALKELGIVPTYQAAEPNTWREVLQTIDRHLKVANQTIGLQEYGQPNPSLVAGIEARGAQVVPIRVYRWELPEDTGPLERNIREMVAGEIDLAMFTSAHQVVNLLELARRLEMDDDLRSSFQTIVVASIGPTTSEMLRNKGLPVDLEPGHPKMGHLVKESAEKGQQLWQRKRRLSTTLAAVARHTAQSVEQPWYESPFMKACRREPCDRVPIWLMRQAGRYMAEYRAVREKTTFLELCKNPELCAEVMITAVQRLGVDAAIIFSDLLPILEPMGLDLEFAQGEGPVIHNPVRTADDIDRVIELESVEALDFVMETVRLTRADLPADIPLIGFAGAPFTLASYAIEGGSSRNYLNTKTLMYRDPGAWNALLGRLALSVGRYLNAQIAAGAQAVQLFDSWVGCLGVEDYRQYVLPHIKTVIDQLTPGVPVINFATGNPALLPLLSESGGDVIGIDWRIGLDDAWRMVGHDKAVQGNLDPTVLLADVKEIRSRAKQVLDAAAGRPGHIFNLGHGVLQQTPVDNVIALVEAVHEFGPSKPS